MSEKPGNKQQASHDSHAVAAPAPLGGARADFVASLGRKANDARNVLGVVLAERGTANERAPREELRRKLHALNVSARMLHFDVMAQSLAEAETVLDRAAQAGRATEDDLATIAHILDDLPALAWGDGPRELAKKPSDPPEEGPLLRTALLVGSEMLAEALTDEDLVPGALPYECERTDDAQAAIGLARKVAPEIVVIDADVADAAELVEALLDDPFTEPVPIVVVGAFREPGTAARFVALGVARTLTKPITAEGLRRACDEAIDHRNDVTMRVTLGEPTLEQLGERLADEVRKAIVESVDSAGRGVRVPLGEGTEVMSAMWGAIARVREVVVARTGGAVRFGGNGPEGAVALAPWLQPDMPGTDRLMASVGRGRGPAADVRLHGRRVIVADDDPGVTWFIADLLRTAGCVVQEALDGKTALDLAYRTSPELVISDILMPGLDGFGLARALKRDMALRDVPVILLSWKEDLLQRVRELGAGAAAYIRKESDSRSILARVRECLRPRARVEARLRTHGEVRGRLDGLTVRALLELTCAIRPESRVGVRDASFLYEMEIRDGAPQRITRTQSDGTFERGERVFGAMLGVGAGRFTVCASESIIPVADRDLSGSLSALLARPVALARAARSVTTGARTMGIERVKLDPETTPMLLASTPEPARSIVKALADGRAPRAMLLGGDGMAAVDPILLEDVLSDLASRGAIQGVWTHTGEEVMAKAVEALLAPAEPVVRAAPTAARRSPSGPPTYEMDAPEPRRASQQNERPRPSLPNDPEQLTPSSLADAVMRELSDRAPELRSRSSNPPPIVEPSELRPRSSKPPAPDGASERSSARFAPPVMSGTPIPPDAVIPAGEEPEGDKTEIDAPVEPDTMGALEQPAPEEESFSIPVEVGSVVSAPVAPVQALVPSEDDVEPPARTPLSSVASRDPIAAEPKGSRSKWPWIVAIALVGGAVLFGVQATKPASESSAAAAGASDPVSVLPLTKGTPIVAEPAAAVKDAGASARAGLPVTP
jgi:CheY-like chemotaxis protein